MSVLAALGQLDRKPRYHAPFRELTHDLPTCGPRDIPHPLPLPNPLGFGVLRRSTSCIHAVVPEGEGEKTIAPTEPTTEETPMRVKAPSIRSMVLNALKEHGPQTLEGLTASQPLKEERIGALQIRNTLGPLRRGGKVIKDEQGRYSLTPPVGAQFIAPMADPDPILAELEQHQCSIPDAELHVQRLRALACRRGIPPQTSAWLFGLADTLQYEI